MILHRIRLEAYRGIERSEVTLDPRGITLVEGPNEIGKSSLAEALGIVFQFPDSSKHARIEAVAPVHRDAGPEIEVELSTGAYRLVYRKRYRKRPETELRVLEPRPETHTGRAAHERMAAILDETLDRALFDALQVVQGERIDQPRLTDSAALRRALDAAAGGGGGDDDAALFARVEAEYLRHWTPSGQPHRERRARAEEERALEAEVGQLEVRQREIESAVREHDRLSAAMVELARALPALERVAETSRQQSEDIAVLRQQIGRAREAAGRAKAEAEIAERRQADRANALAEIAERERALAELGSATASANDAALGQARAAEETGLATVEALRRQVAEAEALARLRTGDHQLRQDELQRDQLGERRGRLEELEVQAREARAVVERVRVDATALERLREAEVSVGTARALLEAAGAKLRLRALAPVEVTWSGRTTRLEAGEESRQTLTERTTLVVGGQLELIVEPGRGIGELRARLAEAEQTHAELLRTLEVGSLGEAIHAQSDRQEAERTLAELDARRRSDLRDLGFDELVAKHERQKERVLRYLDERAAPDPPPTNLEDARRVKDEADAAQRDARARLDASERALAGARERRNALEAAQRERTSRAELLAAQREDAVQRLSAARDAASDADLAAAAERAAEAHAAARRALGALEASFAERDPEAVVARAKGDAGALERARREHRELETSLARVDGQLESERENGFAERLERQRGRLEHARREHARVERHARAAGLLFDRLREARDAARRAYMQPLGDRIGSLGRIVYGDGFSVTLGDDLEIVSRSYGGASVPFASLSTGAKEQLGILVRLAAAITVAGDGGVPVILDDTLGNTDPERLRSMGAVLGRVAESCQILVLTCSPDRFRSLGDVRVVRLAER